jgi:hypothetical protein
MRESYSNKQDKNDIRKSIIMEIEESTKFMRDSIRKSMAKPIKANKCHSEVN